MSWLRRIAQRFKYPWTRFHQRFISGADYVHSIDEKYLWTAFSYLASLDMKEPYYGKDRYGKDLMVFGCGMYLEIRTFDIVETFFHATFQQVHAKELVVQLWRDRSREFDLGFGAKGQTRWWEVYRTGRTLEPEGLGRVLEMLRELYKDGPGLVVTKVDQETKTITCTEGKLDALQKS